MHVDKPQSLWENVLWMDETKLDLFAKSRELYVHRCKKYAYKVNNNNKKSTTVKHGGISVLSGVVLLHLAESVQGTMKSQDCQRKMCLPHLPHSHTLTHGQCQAPNSPHMHAFGLWKEARKPGENSHKKRKNIVNPTQIIQY